MKVGEEKAWKAHLSSGKKKDGSPTDKK